MKKWVEAASVSEFEATDRKLVECDGASPVGLFRVGEEYFAVSPWCTHQRATMMHGDLEGFELVCPLHGARFDIRSGAALSLPAVRGVATYPVKVESGLIYVKM